MALLYLLNISIIIIIHKLCLYTDVNNFCILNWTPDVDDDFKNTFLTYAKETCFDLQNLDIEFAFIDEKMCFLN